MAEMATYVLFMVHSDDDDDDDNDDDDYDALIFYITDILILVENYVHFASLSDLILEYVVYQ